MILLEDDDRRIPVIMLKDRPMSGAFNVPAILPMDVGECEVNKINVMWSISFTSIIILPFL